MKIAGVILGAGYSSRMGKNKMLLPINGLPILGHVIKAVENTSLDKLICVYPKVIGDKDEMQELRKTSYNTDVEWLVNHHQELGQSYSLRLALEKSYDFDAIMIILGDQPLLRESVLDDMIKVAKDKKNRIIRINCNGIKGPPVIIPKRFFNELLEISGDVGARNVIKKYKSLVDDIDIEDEWFNKDVDTPEDYEAVIELMKDGGRYEGFFARNL